MNTKLPAGTLEKLWADPSNWRGEVIYVCTDDPRLIVPKRKWKWGGWTMNFAHVSAWVLLALVILAAVVPAGVLAASRGIGIWGWFAFTAWFIVFSCILSAVLASPKRHESGG